MVKSMPIKHPSILTQLICLLSVSVIALVAVTLTSNRQNTALVQMELSFNARTNVEYLSEQLGDSVARVNSQMELLLTNEDVRGVYTLHSSRSTSEQYMALDRVISLMKFVLLANDDLRDITLYYPELHRYLRASSPHTGEISDTALSDVLFSADYSGLNCVDGKWYLYYAYPFVVYSTRSEPLYYARVEINEEAISGLLSSFRQYHALNMLLHVESGCLITPDAEALSAGETDALFALAASMTEEQVMEELLIGGEPHTAILCREPRSGCVTAQLVANASLYGVSRQMYHSLILFTLAALLMILVYSLFLQRYLHQLLSRIREALGQLGDGDFARRLPSQRSSELDALAAGFNLMAERISALVETNYRQEILLQQAQLKQLQMQISPHFLYNSFYFIENALDMGQMEAARTFLRHLAEYYQFLTRDNSDLLPLAQEYAHVCNYLSLQQMRFGPKLAAETAELPPAWAQAPVPRLILQPLVENTVKHGRDENGCACVAFSFEEAEPDCLCIRYSSRSARLSDADWHSLCEKLKADAFPSSALGNIYQRLQFNGHELQARRLSPDGLEMILLIRRKGACTHGTSEHTDRG